MIVVAGKYRDDWVCYIGEVKDFSPYRIRNYILISLVVVALWWAHLPDVIRLVEEGHAQLMGHPGSRRYELFQYGTSGEDCLPFDRYNDKRPWVVRLPNFA